MVPSRVRRSSGLLVHAATYVIFSLYFLVPPVASYQIATPRSHAGLRRMTPQRIYARGAGVNRLDTFDRIECSLRLFVGATGDDLPEAPDTAAASASTAAPGKRSTSMQMQSIVSSFLLDILLNGSDAKSSVAHRSVVSNAYPVLGDVSEVPLDDSFPIGNRPEQPKVVRPTENILNLKWINYLRCVQSWLDGELCLLKRAVEARSSEVLSDISKSDEVDLENKCVSFFKLYELSDVMIGKNLTDILRRAGYGYVVSSNAPLRGPDGRFVSKASLSSMMSGDGSAQYQTVQSSQSNFPLNDGVQSDDRVSFDKGGIEDPIEPDYDVKSGDVAIDDQFTAGDNIAWYEMKEAGSPIYEEMQKVMGSKALTSSVQTKDIFGVLRAEDRDTSPLPLPPSGQTGTSDYDSGSLRPAESKAFSDGDTDAENIIPPRRGATANRPAGWASRLIRSLAPWK